MRELKSLIVAVICVILTCVPEFLFMSSINNDDVFFNTTDLPIGFLAIVFIVSFISMLRLFNEKEKKTFKKTIERELLDRTMRENTTRRLQKRRVRRHSKNLS